MDEKRSFELYSSWYDGFYEDKCYEHEAQYILEKVLKHRHPIKSWLDVGCGTGKHLACLSATGLDVVGVDSSKQMIDRARRAFPGLPFIIGDAKSFNFKGAFNASSLLFHVVNYLGDDAHVVSSLNNIARHLDDSGILIFDFWHTPAIVDDPPHETIRSVQVNGRTLYRIARPTEDRAQSRVNVDYEFRFDSKAGKVIHAERHCLRHYHCWELAELLQSAGFALLEAEGWMTHSPLTRTDWYGVIVARKMVPGS
jgi:SAM-dependent methyltransferase